MNNDNVGWGVVAQTISISLSHGSNGRGLTASVPSHRNGSVYLYPSSREIKGSFLIPPTLRLEGAYVASHVFLTNAKNPFPNFVQF